MGLFLPALGISGVTMGLIRAAGGIAGGALSAVGGAANLAATTLGIGAKVAGAGLSAVGGGAKALGSAINPFSGGDGQKTAPAGGDSITIKQPKGQQQKQEKAIKQQQATATKTTQIAKDSSRKSDKSAKNTGGALAAIKMQLEKLNNKVGGIIRLVMSGQKADKRAGLESKAESTRESGSDSGVPRGSVIKTGKKLIAKTGGFLSTIFGLILKFFAGKIILGALFPELRGQFEEFQKNVVGIFTNTFDAIKKLFNKDLDGAKKSAGDAFDDLKGALKGIAKFGSDIIDKILGVFGMEEINLYKMAAEKLEKMKEKIMAFVDEKSGFEDPSKKPVSERIFEAIKNVLMDMVTKIATFLSPGNLYRLYKEASKRGEIEEEAQEQIGEVMSGQGGLFGMFNNEAGRARNKIVDEERERLREAGLLKGVSVDKARRIFTDAEKAYDPEDREGSLEKMSEDERALFLAVEDKVNAMRKKMIDEINAEKMRKLKGLPPIKLMPYEDHESKAIERMEKKLNKKKDGATIGDDSANMGAGGVNINDNKKINYNNDNRKSVISTVSKGGGSSHSAPLDNESSARSLEKVFGF